MKKNLNHSAEITLIEDLNGTFKVRGKEKISFGGSLTSDLMKNNAKYTSLKRKATARNGRDHEQPHHTLHHPKRSLVVL